MRRLVYGLRPPALDQVGLVEAVRDLVRQGGEDDQRAGVLVVRVEGPEEGLPDLPAAVEVNAYRIALEALTNVARHALAHRCLIQFSCETLQDGQARPKLLVKIEDDGVGMPEAVPSRALACARCANGPKNSAGGSHRV